MTKNYVTVIFDPNGGGVTSSSKRVCVSEPYGELPSPVRFGYEFDGWFTAEEGGEPVLPDTIVTAEHSHAVYAHWTKNVVADAKLEAYRRKKAAIKRQRALIIAGVVLLLMLIAGLCVVYYFVNRTNIVDPYDGKNYKIIKKDSIYILCDENEKKLPMTEDGKYYVTAAGSQVKLNPETGEASIYAVVDTEGREVVGNIVTARILAFPQVEKARMARLEVHNRHGSYAFIGKHVDTDGDGKIEHYYYIEGHESTLYNQELFASLIVSCGYVLAMDKIRDPAVDENGEYSEYGLVPETRENPDGSTYEYAPAWYTLTDVDGNEYTVIVGDPIVSGAGYYVRYLNPDFPDTPFIYIVSNEIEKTVLQPVEALVQPMIVYPVSLSTYFDVQNFSFASARSDIVIKFSFIPLEERIGTQLTSVPYVFQSEEFKHFNASSTNIDTCLQSFLNMQYIRVVKLAPNDEDFILCGVDDPEYIVYFDRNVREEAFSGTVSVLLSISKMTPSGTYYIYSSLFDMIVEVDREYLPFLEWEPVDWIDKAAYSYNLACTSEITLSSGGKNILFDIDNSDSSQFKLSPLGRSSYTRTDRNGQSTSYYLVQKEGKYSVAVGSASGNAPEVFAENMRYLITSENKLYLIKDTSTTTLDLSSGTTGICTLYVTGYDSEFDAILYIFVDQNTGKWGRVKRDLSSDAVRVTARVDNQTPVLLNTSYFRHFFQTILYASADGECNLTDEEMAALRAQPDSQAQLVMTIKTESGVDTFRFYRYSERRSYMTIGDSGSLYVLSDRVEKIFSDALKVIAGEDVSATSKY
ncbi:MAG TPA: hypothetical protein GX011_04265 [Clostridiales bacterium]|jgi:uncharacterized repeat protein (TIGR02543 family)|nr:hypothetical protein [Clostridiales bacterium]